MPKKAGLRYPQKFKAEAVQLVRSLPKKESRCLLGKGRRNSVSVPRLIEGRRAGIPFRYRAGFLV